MRGVGEGERDWGCFALVEIPVRGTVGAEPAIRGFEVCEARWGGEYAIDYVSYRGGEWGVEI